MESLLTTVNVMELNPAGSPENLINRIKCLSQGRGRVFGAPLGLISVVYLDPERPGETQGQEEEVGESRDQRKRWVDRGTSGRGG